MFTCEAPEKLITGVISEICGLLFTRDLPLMKDAGESCRSFNATRASKSNENWDFCADPWNKKPGFGPGLGILHLLCEAAQQI